MRHCKYDEKEQGGNNVKWKLLLILMSLLLISSVPVFGAVIDEVQVDYDTASVTVTGELPVKKQGQRVGVEVFCKGITPEQADAASDEELMQMISYVGQTLSDNEGKYYFSVPLDGESGEYHLRIGYGDANRSRWKEFYFFNEKDSQRLLTQINQTVTAEEILRLVQEWETMPGVINQPYDQLKNKKAALQYVIEERGAGFASMEAFSNTLWQCSMVQAVAEAVNGSEILNLIQEHEKFFADLPAYATWTALSETGKHETASGLQSKNNYDGIRGLKAEFSEQTILAALKNVESYGRVETILKDNAEFLEIDFSKVSGAGNKELALKALAGKKFENAAAVKTTLYRALEDSNSGNGNGGGGGNRGGGFGSGSGNGTVVPKLSEERSDAAEEKVEELQDLNEAAWAVEAINSLYRNSIVQGDGNGKFRPNAAVTRAEFVTMLVKAFRLTDTQAMVNFVDVTEEDWFYPYVASAMQTGIVRGTAPDRFSPDEHLTREQMAVMIDRCVAYIGITLPASVNAADFKDAGDIAEFARQSVVRMQAAGIINGMGDGSFSPKESSTRAQVCRILYNLLVLEGGEAWK